MMLGTAVLTSSAVQSTDVYLKSSPILSSLRKACLVARYQEHSDSKYVDMEMEFVLENLDISSLGLLPGHVYIRNITDVDITAPAGLQSTTTVIGTLTHIKMQAVQLMLKEVSFFYRDKVATIGPKDFTGLMKFGLPQKGISIDLEFCLIPNTPQGLMECKSLGWFFKIEHIEVNVAEGIDMQVKQSNHPILASVFRPVIMLYFHEAISHTLEEQIWGLDFGNTTW
ncbi:uncharacterized protein F5147DRAFT_803085 [Suillus discolor]|uniref:Uncharacterized protein n=1 Tax=Suillus discolor TaxID=1912936 RepID=A0A9P7F623_9AGAM|nr:uncharacterized protein F5147DRAFT_803085 [Suillus discolor]KAG2107220.1 hypothetical protein F5147DRAFT_803085 [Suillus discolor]